MPGKIREILLEDMLKHMKDREVICNSQWPSMMELLHQWKRATDVIYLEFCKTFDMVTTTSFTPKWRDGFNGQTFRRIRNWLDPEGSGQWLSVLTDISDKWLILGSELLNVFINHTQWQQVHPEQICGCHPVECCSWHTGGP